MSQNIPAFCKNCRYIFNTPIRLSSNSINIEFRDCLTDCPQCFRLVPIPDGSYRVINDVLSVINAPNATHDLLKYLKALAEKAQNDNTYKNLLINELCSLKKGDKGVFGELSKKLNEPFKDILFQVITTLLVAAITNLISDMMNSNEDDVSQKLHVDKIVINHTIKQTIYNQIDRSCKKITHKTCHSR